ncbi:PREDICTED: uncharacterized protein LOC106147725 [Chinchilla lanigera]|uniref:uncharacterized protein LOC106147725 n=1 Tax=Chinchilla lanigera TaxID=34839 RepID=UPI0006988FA4|nr:PREDICTED: uncharacterized protein LOC106147725 [Chinchilla lanigera]
MRPTWRAGRFPLRRPRVWRSGAAWPAALLKRRRTCKPAQGHGQTSRSPLEEGRDGRRGSDHKKLRTASRGTAADSAGLPLLPPSTSAPSASGRAKPARARPTGGTPTRRLAALCASHCDSGGREPPAWALTARARLPAAGAPREDLGCRRGPAVILFLVLGSGEATPCPARPVTLASAASGLSVPRSGRGHSSAQGRPEKPPHPPDCASGRRPASRFPRCRPQGFPSPAGRFPFLWLMLRLPWQGRWQRRRAPSERPRTLVQAGLGNRADASAR